MNGSIEPYCSRNRPPRVGLRSACLGMAAGFAVFTCCLVAADPGSQPPLLREASLRRPSAAAFLDDDRTLCVANQRSGTVSLVDVRQGQVRAEVTAGGHLTDLAATPDRKHILVLDDARHELVILSFDGARLGVRARRSVAPYPASVAILPDGKRATVASLWSRRLQVVDLAPLSHPEGTANLRVLHSIRLPFARATSVCCRGLRRLSSPMRLAVIWRSWMPSPGGCWRFTS